MEDTEYPVVAQDGETGFTKIYGQSISEKDNNTANHVIVAPREYMVLEEKEIGDTVSYAGVEYEIIGQNDGYPWNSFLLPYTLVAEQNLAVAGIDFYFPLDIAADERQGYVDQLTQSLSCEIAVEDYKVDVGMISSKYIIESFFIFALGATNIIFIQQHVQEMKRRFYSVMFLAGMNQRRFYGILLLEACVVFCLSFALAVTFLLGGDALCLQVYSQNYFFLYPDDYFRFFVIYLVGFSVVTLIANIRVSRQPKILVYKESGR